MMQNQKAGDHSIAIQSDGDTIIKMGPDLPEILHLIAHEVKRSMVVAEEKVTTRLAEIQQEMLERFAKLGLERSEAFQDPDVIEIIREAQYLYSRSGDPKVKNLLVDLVANRAKCLKQNRLALTINSALKKASILTEEEISEITLCFIIKNTINHTIYSPDDFMAYFQKYISPYLEKVSFEETSYQYLVSEGCASLEIVDRGGLSTFQKNYPTALAAGFHMRELEEMLPSFSATFFKQNPHLLMKCFNDEEKFQFRAGNETQLKQSLLQSGLPEADIDRLAAMYRSSVLHDTQIIELFSSRIPDLTLFKKVWVGTLMRRLTLTAPGIAIAHANALRCSQFEGELEIWIN